MDENGAPPKRCRWCGAFVAADTEPITRTVYGVSEGVAAWRTYTQLLCPSDAAAWSRDAPWNRASTPDEVEASCVR